MSHMNEMTPKLAEALERWLDSWDDQETTPDPDDLPEEAELYEAATEWMGVRL